MRPVLVGDFSVTRPAARTRGLSGRCLAKRAACGLLAGVLALGAAARAQAWGAQGHRAIAALALGQLSDAARREVDRLLALEPGATLMSISTWADEVRSPVTAPWHYVNLPVQATCRYAAERDCPDGSCVVAAIQSQRQLLRTAAVDASRLQALKYLVHFVADVHQPLHAGDAQDRGGNLFQIQFGGRGTNLHALWDRGLIELPGGPMADWLALPPTVGPAAHDPIDPAAWAEESCQIVAQPWFYPAGRRIDADYVERALPVVEQRLSDAARRLASVLNNSLAEPRE